MVDSLATNELELHPKTGESQKITVDFGQWQTRCIEEAYKAGVPVDSLRRMQADAQFSQAAAQKLEGVARQKKLKREDAGAFEQLAATLEKAIIDSAKGMNGEEFMRQVQTLPRTTGVEFSDTDISQLTFSEKVALYRVLRSAKEYGVSGEKAATLGNYETGLRIVGESAGDLAAELDEILKRKAVPALASPGGPPVTKVAAAPEVPPEKRQLTGPVVETLPGMAPQKKAEIIARGQSSEVSLRVGRLEIAAGISEQFKTQFNAAITNGDGQRLDNLRQADPAQYNCALLLLIDNAVTGQANYVDQARDSGDKRRRMADSVGQMVGYFSAIPGARDLIKAVMGMTMDTTAAPLVHDFASQNPNIMDDHSAYKRLQLAMQSLTPEKLAQLTKEVQQIQDMVNLIAYLKAMVDLAFADNLQFRQGVQGMRAQARLFLYPKLACASAAQLNASVGLGKVTTIAYINNNERYGTSRSYLIKFQ